jgi:hypothetical protein
MNGEDEQKLPCHEKVAFDTKQEASAAGLAADWQHGTTLKAYSCKHCNLWHLASSYDK